MFAFLVNIKVFMENNFAPKIYEVLKAGYTFAHFKRDCMSGLTVAIISLPLAMAFAIAAGVSPDKGLYTAIVAGFLISLLGGSRYQIGGPTGAFVIVIFNIIAQFGYSGLLMAMVMAGVILIIAGLFRLGSYIKYVPYPVVIGFTSGIAVLLFSTQIKDLLGLQVEDLPAEVLPKWIVYFQNWDKFTFASILISVVTFVVIMFVDWKKPKLPAYLIGLTVATCLVVVLSTVVSVDTIGNKFGGLPLFLPKPEFPVFDMHLALKVFPSALTIAFLTGIESLLSATIIDGISGDNHNSNAELIANGIATIAVASFAGLPATGAIARTAANYKAKAYSPVSGIIHSVFLLLFMLILSPVARYIPLSALSVVLIIIAFNMFGFKKFWNIMTISRGERITLLITFFLTIFVDLNVAISVGFILSSIMFMHSMSQEVEVEAGDAIDIYRKDYEQTGSDIEENLVEKGVMSLRFSGPLFFGVVSDISNMFKEIVSPKILILRMSRVNVVDASGVNALVGFLKRVMRNDTKIIFAHVRKQPQRLLIPVLKKENIFKEMSFTNSFKNALLMAKRHIRELEKDEAVEDKVIEGETIKELVREAEIAAKEVVKQAKEAAKEVMREAKEVAKEATKQAKETVREVEVAAKEAVKEAELEAKELAKKASNKDATHIIDKDEIKEKIIEKATEKPEVAGEEPKGRTLEKAKKTAKKVKVKKNRNKLKNR